MRMSMARSRSQTSIMRQERAAPGQDHELSCVRAPPEVGYMYVAGVSFQACAHAHETAIVKTPRGGSDAGGHVNAEESGRHSPRALARAQIAIETPGE